MKKSLTISLVIPAFNEQRHLGACLEAALNQRLPFDEIIVVDNNSTDATIDVATRFPEVTLLREPRQGVVHARNTGFNAAHGEIIARIDADTLLPPDWSAAVQQVFENEAVDAVTGVVQYY